VIKKKIKKIKKKWQNIETMNAFASKVRLNTLQKKKGKF